MQHPFRKNSGCRCDEWVPFLNIMVKMGKYRIRIHSLRFRSECAGGGRLGPILFKSPSMRSLSEYMTLNGIGRYLYIADIGDVRARKPEVKT